MSRPPQELLDYLAYLIGTPKEPGVYFEDLNQVNWAGFEDNSVPGLIVQGTPTDEQAAQMLRILMPGAHLLLVAPDNEPTGHTGACLIEDVGFEIRDAILLVQEPGKLHYVPKTARTEREAGCLMLPAKAGFEAVEREEGSAGVNNPRAGAGRTANTVHNFHPTVKPKELMLRLLADVPVGEGPVVDPFMGSGSTGLACVESGHDFIGIERESDYLAIADARVRYWDKKKDWTKNPATIISDAQATSEPSEPINLEDLFGWGSDEK